MSSSSFRLVYKPHARWPLPSRAKQSQSSSATSTSSNQFVRICVLDSSFNPPSSAHLALIKHSPWPSTSDGHNRADAADSTLQECDARLLILSTNNADKGQASHNDVSVRLEMMQAVARQLNDDDDNDETTSLPLSNSLNVAVACTDASTFAAKSHILKKYLSDMSHVKEAGLEIRMLFPLGWDTVTRFFAPRYYADPERPIERVMDEFFNKDGSSLACARRGNVPSQDEIDFLKSGHVKPWRDRVEMFDLDAQDAKDVSSTRIRQLVKDGNVTELRKLVPVEQVRNIIDREGLYRR
ncbi:hypothetical protein ACM66B_006157 [Microbotryomycetes sp. NB124-2]